MQRPGGEPSQRPIPHRDVSQCSSGRGIPWDGPSPAAPGPSASSSWLLVRELVSVGSHRELHVDAQNIEDRVVHVGHRADLTLLGCLLDARIAPCRDRQTSVERLPEEFRLDTASIRSRMADRDQDRPRTCEVLSNEVQRERQPTLTELCNPLGCGQSNTGEGSSGFEGRPSPPWKNDSSSHAGRRTPPRGLALKAAHVDGRIAEWQSRHRPQLSDDSPGGK